MSIWEVYRGSDKDWNFIVSKFNHYTIYQSSEWCIHKSNSGWNTIKIVKIKDDVICAAAQILYKKFPFKFIFCWIPGGPIGDLSHFDPYFQNWLKKILCCNFIYCRIGSNQFYNIEIEKLLTNNRWKSSKYKINSGLTMYYFPNVSESIRHLNLSSNWRHNLKRSFKNNLNTYEWILPDLKLMSSAYREMEKYKKIGEQNTEFTISSIFDVFKEQAVIVRCDDENGNLLALRGALILNNKAWDFFAVTLNAGRNKYASHACFWKLMKICEDKEIELYDMGGIDPINAKGVYDFKKGTGAEEVKFVGEWEFSSPKLLNVVVNKLIKKHLANV